MKKIEISTPNFTKKDLVNSRFGKALQEMADGFKFGTSRAAILEDTDEDTGEVKAVAVFVDEESGELFTSISSTVVEAAETVIEIICEEGRCDCRLGKRKSNAGREFLTLMVL